MTSIVNAYAEAYSHLAADESIAREYAESAISPTGTAAAIVDAYARVAVGNPMGIAAAYARDAVDSFVRSQRPISPIPPLAEELR